MILSRLLLILSVLLPAICMAEVSNDRLMAKIVRDGQTYISADVRDSSEEAARAKASEQLLSSVKDFLKSESSAEIDPEAVTISSLSGISHMLSSKIADDRYRVVLYVEKADLRQSEKSVRQVSEPTPVVTSTVSEPKREPTVKSVEHSESSPVVRMISQLSTRQEVVEKLKVLHKSRTISGGASFPLADANDFYVVVIDGDKVVTTLHFLNGKYIDGSNSKVVDINDYAHYSGYWFTIPN